jgi:hypothetical protein
MRFFIRITVVSLLLACIVFACKKEEDKALIITGRIIDGNQNKAVTDAEVTFWVSRMQNGTYNPDLIELSKVNTDASGNYSFNITKEKDAAYRITIDKANYYSQLIDINADDLPAGNHVLNYNILPVAYFKLHVKNVNSFDVTDLILYNINGNHPSLANCCNNGSNSGLGYSFDKTQICKTYGAQNIKVEWTVKRNGFSTSFDSTIYCIPFDTTTFNLNY